MTEWGNGEVMGERPEHAFARSPIILAALAAHGLDVEALPWEQGENTHLDVVQRTTPDLVHLTLTSDASANLHWYRPHPMHSASYLLDGDVVKVHVSGLTLPETALTHLPGRALSDVIDLPGGENAVIRTASILRLTTGDDLVLDIVHEGDRA